jgi:hypothetical protein
MTLATTAADRKQKNQKIWSWRHAIEETDMPPLSKLLAFAIANDLSDIGKYTQRPTKELARVCGMSVRSVENHSRKLVDMNLLHIEVLRDTFGRPTGRRWFPKFPDNFRLDDGPAQRADYYELDAEHSESGAYCYERDDVRSAPRAEPIYKDSTFPKTGKEDSCRSQAPDEPEDPFSPEAPRAKWRGAGPERPAGAGPSNEVPPEQSKSEEAGPPSSAAPPKLYPEAFDNLWAKVPQAAKRGGKKKPFEVWKRASAAVRVQIDLGVVLWAKRVKGTDPKFIEMAQTWFNQARWETEADAAKPTEGADDYSRVMDELYA